MKQIKPTANEHNWPRSRVKAVKCGKRDLVVRITNWMSDRDKPAYNVEVYIGGVYDWNESECFPMHQHKTEETCKALAIAFANAQIAKLL